MVLEQPRLLQIACQIAGDLGRAVGVEVVPGVPGVSVPVDLQLVVHQIHVHLGTVQLLRQVQDAVVFGITPVEGAGGAQQEQLGPIFLTQVADGLHVGEVHLGDGGNFLSLVHVVGVLAGLNLHAVAVALVVVRPSVVRLLGQVCPRQVLPPVVIQKDGKVFSQHGDVHLGFGDLPVDGVGLQDDQLGLLGLEGPLDHEETVVQGLAAGGGHVGGVSRLPPQLHGGDGGVGLAVSHHHHVDGVLPLPQNAVGADLFHAELALVVLGQEEQGKARKQEDEAQRKSQDAQHPFAVCHIHAPLKTCVHGVDGQIASPVGPKDHHEKDQPVVAQPAHRQRPPRQGLPQAEALLLLEQGQDKEQDQGDAQHEHVVFVQAQGQDAVVPEGGQLEVGEDLPEHGQPRPQAVGPEEELADAHQHRRAGDLHPPVGQGTAGDTQGLGGPQGKGVEEILQQNQGKVVHAEEDVVPPCPVPQAVAQPHAEQGDGSGYQGAEVVAHHLPGPGGQLFHGLCHGQGIEHIVLKPGAQGDVPALPELRNALGEEWPPEVLRQGDAEDLAGAHHQVHGSGEVHIQLDGVAHHGHGNDKAVVVLIALKDGADEEVQPVGDHQLFHHAEQKALQAKGEVVIGEPGRLPQLPRGLLIAADGPLHDLGEEAEKQGQPQQIGVGGDLPAINVEEVGGRLQGVEGDADGHEKGRRGQLDGAAQGLEEIVDVDGKKHRIFQRHQDAHQGEEGQGHHRPLPGLGLPAQLAAVGFFAGGNQCVGSPLYLGQPQPKIVDQEGGQEQVDQ